MIRIKQFSGKRIAAALLTAVAGWGLSLGPTNKLELSARSETAVRKPTGYPQLVATQPLPAMNVEMCPLETASLQEPNSARRATSANANGTRTGDADRSPLRVIRDAYPTYSAIGVDTNSNEVFLQDENLFGIKVFNRTDNTSPGAAFTEPKRVLGGLLTKLEFNCALYIDPKSGDIYSVNNDTVDTLTVFPRDAKGNVKPMRALGRDGPPAILAFSRRAACNCALGDLAGGNKSVDTALRQLGAHGSHALRALGAVFVI